MTPLVSVIIPCRNGVPWLADAIESCLDQTYRNLQVIVVDNGSTDESVNVAARYGSSVTMLACARNGASAARNTGLAHAEGELIQFLDADDVLDRDKIRRQVERLGSGPPGSVSSGAWARFGCDPSEASFAAEPVWRDLAPHAFLISSWLGGGMMPSFAWLTPRALIEKAGPWNEKLSLNDDGEFFCRVVLASSAILFCSEARGYYRGSSETTLSRRRDRDALISGYSAIDLSCQRLLRQSGSPEARQACATYYQRFVFDAYPDAPDLVEAAEHKALTLGGGDLRIEGGGAFKIIAATLGWKFAKRCRLAWQGLRRRTTLHRAGAISSGLAKSPDRRAAELTRRS
jgi:glycosyltransferase involved in cell wall biosynthesis